MAERIICPKCRKMNDIHKFCIYCGHKLPIDDDQIRLMKENPKAYCLNCGRPAEKGQIRCECGYEFADIRCPKCSTANAYANRFCISCGKKLWTSDVYQYKYPERLFEYHLIDEALPSALNRTSLNRRNKKKMGKNPLSDNSIASDTVESLRFSDKRIDMNLGIIRSRWKIVSPNYCINCLGTMSPDEHICPKCGFNYSDDKKRIEDIKSVERYVMPQFNDTEMKWMPKGSPDYSYSLAPAIGESQFEYRERLKWDFSENNHIKKHIEQAIKIKTAPKPPKRPASTQNQGYYDGSREEEWDLYCMTQDQFERWRAEENARENEEHLEHWKEFWGDK